MLKPDSESVFYILAGVLALGLFAGFVMLILGIIVAAAGLAPAWIVLPGLGLTLASIGGAAWMLSRKE